MNKGSSNIFSSAYIDPTDASALSGIFVPIAGGTMTGTLTLNPAAQTGLNDAATIGQLAAFVAGAAWKSPGADVATTGNITLSGEQTIDGVLTSSSRVLVKNQTTQSQNGIYVSAAGAWTRATDADASGELNAAAITVIGGTANAGTSWVQTTANPTIGTSAIVWAPFGISYLAGSGLALTGNVFSIATAGIVGSMLSPTINITTTGDIVADDFTGDAASFNNLQITGTGTSGWINLHGQASPPASAITAGDIRMYANTAGFGGVGFKTFGGQALEFNIDQVNTGYAKVIIQDLTSMIMANVPATVGGGNFVVTDGSTLSAQASIPFSQVTGTVPEASGGTNANLSAVAQGAIFFQGASSTFASDDANLHFDDTNNRLGIGVNTPNSRLTVGQVPALSHWTRGPGAAGYGADAEGITLAASTAGTQKQIKAIIHSTSAVSGANGGSLLCISQDNGGLTAAGDRIGGIIFGGAANGSNDIVYGASITAHAGGTNWNIGSAPGELHFNTTGTILTVPTTRMTIFSNGAAAVGTNNTTQIANMAFTVQPLSLGAIGVLVRGLASQTGDLMEFQDSSATVLAKVTSAGNIFGTSFRSTGLSGAGFVEALSQSVKPTSGASGFRMYSNNSGQASFLTYTANGAFSFDPSLLNADHVYQLQNSDYIIANVPVTSGIVRSNGSTLSIGQVDLSNSSEVNNTLSPANGGTGNTTVISNAIYFGLAGIFAQSAALQFDNSTNLLTVSGNASVQNLQFSRHLISGGSAPSIVRGTGSGPTSTVSIAGTDSAGTITVATAGGPSTNAVIFTVTFSNPYSATPRVVFSPGNRNAAGLNANQAVFSTGSTTTFTFTSGATALTNNTTFIWHYEIIQ